MHRKWGGCFYPLRTCLVASTRATGTAFLLIDNESYQSECFDWTVNAEKTFYPVKIASGRSPLRTEHNCWIVGNGCFMAEIVACKCLAELQVPQSRKKLEDWPHAPVINSQAPLLSVSEANWSLHWRGMSSYPSRNQVNSRGNGKSSH